MKTSISLPFGLAIQFLTALGLAQRLVSIGDDLPSDGHRCLEQCVYFPGVYDDIGSALACGGPVENECYCATATGSASVASSWINKCATSRCAGGDLTRDISSMRSIYAGYCNKAGYTQPIVSEWFTTEEEESKTTAESSTEEDTRTTAEPSRTDDSQPAETSTKLTIVTETSESKPPGSGATRSRVIVEQTSTLWVDDQGSIIPAPDGSQGSRLKANKTKQLGIGLGVGIGVALILVAIGVWLYLRRRKQNQFQSQAAAYGYGQGNDTAPPSTEPEPPTQTVSPVSSPASRVERKAVPSPMSTPSPFQPEKTELSSQHVVREVSGTEVHPFPNVTSSPPVPLPGQHEMWAEGRTQPVNELAQSDPRYELGRSDPRYELGRNDLRYELPGK